MDDHHAAPIRLVTGLAGQGKTSALHAWARSFEREDALLIWISTDSGLCSRTAFWRFVLHHLGRGGVSIELDLIRALEHPDESIALLPALLAEQFEASGPVVLVVDGRPDLPDGAVLEDLRRLADHVAGFQVVFASRILADAAANPTAEAFAPYFPPGALLFDDAEIIEVARSLGIRLTPDEAAHVRAVSAGWPAAALALLHAGRPHGARLPDTMLARLLDPFRTDPGFSGLLVASLDEHAVVTDLARADDLAPVRPLLERVRAAGLGTWDDASREQFTVHPLLRDALQREFSTTDADRLRKEHRRLALLQVTRVDATGSAFEHAIKSQDWAAAARVYRRHLLTLTGRRASSILSQHGIPAKAQQAHPILRFAMALEHYSNGRRMLALRGLTTLLAQAEGRQLSGRNDRIDDLWVQAVVMIGLRLLGRHEMARSALHRLTQMIERVSDPDGEVELARTLLLTHGATTLLLADRLTEASRFLDEAGVDPVPNRPALERARVLGMRALVAALRGDIRSAACALETRRLLPLGVELAKDSYSALPAMVATALVHLEHGETDQAEEALSHTASHAPTTELWPLLLLAHTLVEWQRLGASAALTLLNSTLHDRGWPGSHGPFAGHIFIVLRVSLLLALGRYADARHTLGEAPHRRSRRWATLRAQVELLAGDPGRAAALASAALTDAPTPRTRLTLHVIAAAAARRSCDEASAVALGKATVLLAERHDLALPLALVPRDEAEAVIGSDARLSLRLDALHLFPAASEPTAALSSREAVVLRHLVDDRTVDQIAASLSVSKNTVKSQLSSVYRKLGVSNRAEAVAEARRRHLL